MILDIIEHYKDHVTLWSLEQANKLPPHTEYDHTITFKDPKAKPPNRPIYKATWEGKEALRAYIAENQPPGKICKSTSSTASPNLFVRKPNGTLCLCVDYRGINALVEPNRYPIPLMDELRDEPTAPSGLRNSILRMDTTLSASKKAMNGKLLLRRSWDFLNTLSCHLVWPMPQQHFRP